jgi:F0F1-type ATP synthase assembly protein I
MGRVDMYEWNITFWGSMIGLLVGIFLDNIILITIFMMIGLFHFGFKRGTRAGAEIFKSD